MSNDVLRYESTAREIAALSFSGIEHLLAKLSDTEVQLIRETFVDTAADGIEFGMTQSRVVVDFCEDRKNPTHITRKWSEE